MSQDALVFDRAVAQLLAAERHVGAHEQAYADRDDLAPTQLLLRTLRMIIEDALREILMIQREMAQPPEPSAAEHRRYLNTIRSTARRTAALVGQAMHYVVTPHGREFDPLAAAYGRMAREIEPSAEIVFRGSERRHYALSAPLLGPLSDNLKNRSSPFVAQLNQLPTLLFVQYPAAAEGDVLQHLLVAHEIAHLVLRRERHGDVTEAEARFSAAVKAHSDANPNWHAEPAEPLGPTNDARGGDSPARIQPTADNAAPPRATAGMGGGAGQRRRERDRARRWFVEIACDLLAMRLVGPAYYIALCEHALIRHWFYAASDPDNETHPHMAWRLDRAASQLSHFIEAMDGEVRSIMEGAIQPYMQEVPDPEPKVEEEGDWGTVVSIALDALTNDLNASPDSLLGAAALRPEVLADEFAPILTGLRAGMAPAEDLSWTEAEVLAWTDAPGETPPPWSSPRDWRSILTAGYVHVLEQVASRRPVDPLRGRWEASDDARQSVVGHLRGTVELTEFQRRASGAIDRLRALDAGPTP